MQYELHGFEKLVIYLIVIGAIGIAVPILILTSVINTSESIPFTAKKLESNDYLLFVFVSGYFMPIINFGVNLDIVKGILIALFFFLIFWVMTNIPAHPVLRLLFRYKFYKVESSSGVVYTLISKKELKDPQNIRQVKKISDWMLIEVNHVV